MTYMKPGSIFVVASLHARDINHWLGETLYIAQEKNYAIEDYEVLGTWDSEGGLSFAIFTVRIPVSDDRFPDGITWAQARDYADEKLNGTIIDTDSVAVLCVN